MTDAGITATAGAQEAAAQTDTAGKNSKKQFVHHPAPVSKTLHWSGAGSSFDYVATAGHVDIREKNGDPLGSLFCLSYTVEPCAAASPTPRPGNPRPVVFAYNGGPGSASVPINIGGIGPRIVEPKATENMGPAPFSIIDNPDTVLQWADLVVIDALGTGWSKLAEGVKANRAYGVDADAECFARCIEAWLAKTGRYNSPLYIFGESYGTTRNAVLCTKLEELSIPLAGIIMLSSLFDWSWTTPGNSNNYIVTFPTYAAIARYHGKASTMQDGGDDEFFEAACHFATHELAPALILGDQLEPAKEDELAQAMSAFTGLPVAYLKRRHLRVEATDFRWELLHDEGLVCGRFDGRFTFEAGNYLQLSREGNLEYEDPSGSAAEGAWAAAWHHVVENEIGYHNPLPYLQGDYGNISPKWKFTHRSAGAQYATPLPDVTFDLATALRRSPHTRLLIMGGRYDLATPYLAPVLDLARMYLGERTRKNVSWKLYGAGHMVYINPEARAQMGADLAVFLGN